MLGMKPSNVNSWRRLQDMLNFLLFTWWMMIGVSRGTSKCNIICSEQMRKRQHDVKFHMTVQSIQTIGRRLNKRKSNCQICMDLHTNHQPRGCFNYFSDYVNNINNIIQFLSSFFWWIFRELWIHSYEGSS